MSREREKPNAWQHFWTDGGGRKGAGCLPQRSDVVDAAQRAVWEGFARKLPTGASVLDVGTGGGIVLAWMAGTRSDLKLTGIDSAPSLPPSPKGTKLLSGIDMRKLPFPAHRFDAAVSQFGYEYGDVEATSIEIARMVKPGGHLLFLIHHSASPIVSHNLARREALLWPLMPGGYLERAKTFATHGMALGLPIPASFRAGIDEARQRYPAQSVAAEIVTGILQRLESGQRTPGGAGALLDQLERSARGEAERIALLGRAAHDRSRIEETARQLVQAGFGEIEISTVPERSTGQPLAWLLRGVLDGAVSGPGTSR